MSFKIIKKLPSVEELIQEFPLSENGHRNVARHRREIKEILNGEDKRLMIIVGPCSAWPAPAVLEYAQKLALLEKKVQNKLKLIMRVYIQKPRTTKGWTGPVNQPNPFEAADIEQGGRYARELMVKINELGLPVADEALFTHNSKSFMELLSWVAVGARSAEDQEHRIHASSLPCPVGMKNPTSGSIEIGVNGIIAAQRPHVVVFDGYQVETAGNPFAHLVLRGGNHGPNYHKEDLFLAKSLFDSHKIPNPGVIIDASHDNCKINGVKDPREQKSVIREVMYTVSLHPILRTLVKGFMLESFMKTGCQKLETQTEDTVDREGLSITDPCLGWEETEEFLMEIGGEG